MSNYIQLCNMECHHFGEAFTPCIETIAFSLAHINRYTGHAGTYSVATHSVLVAKMLPDHLKLAGLLHDASEAFLGDVSAPLKAIIGPEYSRLEKRYQILLGAYYGVDLFDKAIKEADYRMFATEVRDLGLDVSAYSDLEPYTEITVTKQKPEVAYEEFMTMFNELVEAGNA